jgi:hypothetical protein
MVFFRDCGRWVTWPGLFAELILMWLLDCPVDHDLRAALSGSRLWDLGLFPACGRGSISGSVITTCSRLLDHDLLPAVGVWRRLAGVKAKPCRVAYGQP